MDFQILSEWTERILSACPSQTWRTLYCLWRHAGLRRQAPIALKPTTVDSANKRLFVHATKTERYKNGGDREVPISPILARELERQLEEVPSGESYLIFENRRKSFNSGFKRILFDAGLDKWGKTFQNMVRAVRAIGFCKGFQRTLWLAGWVIRSRFKRRITCVCYLSTTNKLRAKRLHVFEAVNL